MVHYCWLTLLEDFCVPFCEFTFTSSARPENRKDRNLSETHTGTTMEPVSTQFLDSMLFSVGMSPADSYFSVATQNPSLMSSKKDKKKGKKNSPNKSPQNCMNYSLLNLNFDLNFDYLIFLTNKTRCEILYQDAIN